MGEQWLDEDTLTGLALAVHALNAKARHVYLGEKFVEVRGRCFTTAWDDETHNYVVTGERKSA